MLFKSAKKLFFILSLAALSPCTHAYDESFSLISLAESSAYTETTYEDIATLIELSLPVDKTAAVKNHKGRKYRLTAQDVENITPYLLPSNHSLKPILDSIFSKSRVLASIEEVEKAGFKILFHRQGRGLIVASHPLVKKYLFKMYLDTLPKAEWPSFVRRAKGAEMIQNVILTHGYEDLVKVPKKMLYRLPEKPAAQKDAGVHPKRFILVVEHMMITDDATNKEYYANVITRGHLKALKHIIEECGLSDSHVGNIPFCYDNKIAFIDTEYINTWPVHLEWITPSLKADKLKYWKKLLKK